MDLNTIIAIARPRHRGEIGPFLSGDAILAGGTWLFSEPQRHLRRLIDLSATGWEPLRAHEDKLSIAATCSIATLNAFEPPAAWTAATLIGQCCRAFLASFKIWNMATVGGNLCMALPAGPMISLCAALDGLCTIWMPEGEERHIEAVDFVEEPQRPALRPGEILRSIDLPREALIRRTAFRRASLTSLGRSGVLLIGTLSATGRFALTVTAATRRPVQIAFDRLPEGKALAAGLVQAIPDTLYHDDLHGRPDWRRHMTFAFAEEIRDELAAGRVPA